MNNEQLSPGKLVGTSVASHKHLSSNTPLIITYLFSKQKTILSLYFCLFKFAMQLLFFLNSNQMVALEKQIRCTINIVTIIVIIHQKKISHRDLWFCRKCTSVRRGVKFYKLYQKQRISNNNNAVNMSGAWKFYFHFIPLSQYSCLENIHL